MYKRQKEDRFNALESANPKVEYVLIRPIQGKVSSLYDLSQRHFGVDIPAKTNSLVKAITDGRVIFSEWTVDTGHVIIIEHSFGLTSVYKHNSSGIVSQGDYVQAGQAIAFSGNTGELSTGPHLHYEILINGRQVNPLKVRMPSGKPVNSKDRKAFLRIIQKIKQEIKDGKVDTNINEDEKKGSLLVAYYGKGAFIYTGLSFFRQLPNGIPGA